MNIDSLLFLPKRLKTEIISIKSDKGILEEIRIRKNRNAYVIISGKNVILNIIVNESEMLEIIRSVTRGSLYAYKSTILQGYIPYGDGVRIGIVGSVGLDGEAMTGVYDINELAVRLPNRITVDVSPIVEIVKNSSALIYSPPGEGKTTLLRELVRYLSSGVSAKRVAVIDTREELGFLLADKSSLSILLKGYPRSVGVEIAVRSMNAQIIACDEIGNDGDSKAFLNAQIAGVPIVATCHGGSLREVLSHNGIRSLHERHIFDYYIGIKRGKNMDYTYNVSTWEEGDGFV